MIAPPTVHVARTVKRPLLVCAAGSPSLKTKLLQVKGVELFAAPTTLKTRLSSVPVPARAVVLKETTCTAPNVLVLGVSVQPSLKVPATVTSTRLSTFGSKVRRKS